MAKKKNTIENFLSVPMEKYRDEKFTYKFFKICMEEHNFMKQNVDMIDPNMFADPDLRTIMGALKQRFSDTFSVPDYDTLVWLATNNISEAIRSECIKEKIKKIKDTDYKDYDVVAEQSRKWLIQMRMIKAINQSKQIIESGNEGEFEKIPRLLEEALSTTHKDVARYRIFDGYEEALSPQHRLVIPTSSDFINENFLCGGIGKQELGLVIAPSGIGKTSMMCGFAAAAATYKCKENDYKGYKVIHFHFEDLQNAMKRKYYGYCSGIDPITFDIPDQRKKLDEFFKTDEGEEYKRLIDTNIWGVYVGDDEHAENYSVSDVKEEIMKNRREGFIPDLVIIDYFERLNVHNEDSDNEYTKQGNAMKRLESFCKKFDIAMWVPVQGTKDSFDKDYMGMSSAGGSVTKVQVGTIVMGITATEEQKRNNLVNLSLPKFRPGGNKENKVDNIQFNHGTCRFGKAIGNLYTTLPTKMEQDDLERKKRELAKRAAK